MIAWRLSDFGKIEKTDNREALEGIDSVKVRITRALITEDDIAIACGEDKTIKRPIILGRMAVGQVSELGQDSGFLEKGTRVFLSPVKQCGKCYHCTNDNPEDCYDFRIAGKNVNGFLKDFAVLNTSDVYSLPASVKDEDAIYIEYIALALSVIDKLKVEKGQHVAVMGANVFGSILSQLLIYYQAVPILLDEDESKLRLAKKSGIYYTVNANAKAEKEVCTLTGGRMASKVVFVTRSGLNSELAYKLAAPSSTVAYAGFTYPNLKTPVNVAMSKQLSTVCVTNGYGNYLTAINLLANKAIDLSNYALPITKMDNIISNVEEMSNAFKKKESFSNLYINMLG
ncbi:MAG: hypothetical protein E7360_00570 [Clostridiales bacterium]|nr:hypothetical protein [Clostridiales bacterium]